MNRPVLRVLAAAAALVIGLAGVGLAQNPNCGVLQGAAETMLPGYSGAIPGGAEVSLGGDSSHVYVLTQWGFARASLASPANPSPYQITNIGKYHGNGGKIQIMCDCHQGANKMDVAQAPDGTARMVSDWIPFNQDQGGSGLAAQLAQVSGGGNPSFGQQIDLPDRVAGGRIAAVYVAPDRYFGYFPVLGSGVYLAVLDDPTGQTSPPIATTQVIDWRSLSGVSPGARLKAAHVSIPGYDKYLLVGATFNDMKLHVAEINPSTGFVTEVASGEIQGGEFPAMLDVAVVNGQIFVFAAGEAGLRVHSFDPPNSNLPGSRIHPG